jgi:hypothetical protein
VREFRRGLVRSANTCAGWSAGSASSGRTTAWTSGAYGLDRSLLDIRQDDRLPDASSSALKGNRERRGRGGSRPARGPPPITEAVSCSVGAEDLRQSVASGPDRAVPAQGQAVPESGVEGDHAVERAIGRREDRYGPVAVGCRRGGRVPARRGETSGRRRDALPPAGCSRRRPARPAGRRRRALSIRRRPGAARPQWSTDRCPSRPPAWR